MKKIIGSMITSTLLSLSAWGVTPVITVVEVSEDIFTVQPSSSIWQKAKESEITLYPQTTIKLNDKVANELNAHNLAQRAFVKALSDGKHIAFKIRWQDLTQSVQSGDAFKNSQFPDGFAVQFATHYDKPTQLPYIGMGSKDRPVVLYVQKAVKTHYEPNGHGDVSKQINRNNANVFNSKLNDELKEFDSEVEKLSLQTYQRAFISEGFKSMTEIKDQSTSYRAQMHYNTNWFSPNEWEGVMVRALSDEYTTFNAVPFPVAFALWDGEKMGRDGLKNLSTWLVAEFEKGKKDESLTQGLALNLAAANIEKGKALTQTHCASCHNYAQVNEAASVYMAPNLSNIGGYSTLPYLVESIKEPNAVVVPGYNVNAHTNFAWYYSDGQGGRTSAMPAFDYLSSDEINDIVAFLQTLKAEVK